MASRVLAASLTVALLLGANIASAQRAWFEIESEGTRLVVDRDGQVLLGGRVSGMRFAGDQLTIHGRTILRVLPNGDIQKRSGEVVARLTSDGEATRGPGRLVFGPDGRLAAHGPDGSTHPWDYRLLGTTSADAKRAAMIVVLVFALGLESSLADAPAPSR